MTAIMGFFSKKNTASLISMFELQRNIVLAKLILINKLNKLANIDTFVKTSKGFKVTGQEGFVAIDKLGGDAVKLVDRMEFSYNNFSPDILKGWDQRAGNNMDSFKSHSEGKSDAQVLDTEMQEALSHAQRIKAKIRFKKIKNKIKLGRERAMRKTPNMDVVKKRAARKARLMLLKKLTKGQGKDELSFARRSDLEKRLDKMKPRIQAIAKKLIPAVRKQDRDRKQARSNKNQ